MFYLTTHSTHFMYGYMASDIWLRTNLIARKDTRCRHIGYYFRLTARVILYAPSHRQNSTYHGLCYTSRGALVRNENSTIKTTMTIIRLDHYFASLKLEKRKMVFSLVQTSAVSAAFVVFARK